MVCWMGSGVQCASAEGKVSMLRKSKSLNGSACGCPPKNPQSTSRCGCPPAVSIDGRTAPAAPKSVPDADPGCRCHGRPPRPVCHAALAQRDAARKCRRRGAPAHPGRRESGRRPSRTSRMGRASRACPSSPFGDSTMAWWTQSQDLEVQALRIDCGSSVGTTTYSKTRSRQGSGKGPGRLEDSPGLALGDGSEPRLAHVMRQLSSNMLSLRNELLCADGHPPR